MRWPSLEVLLEVKYRVLQMIFTIYKHPFRTSIWKPHGGLVLIYYALLTSYCSECSAWVLAVAACLQHCTIERQHVGAAQMSLAARSSAMNIYLTG